MEKRPKRQRKCVPIKRPVKEVIEHAIPYEVIKESSSDVVRIRCSYCCKLFDSVKTHKEHGCRKVNDFLIKCVSCMKPYVDHCLNTAEKQSIQAVNQSSSEVTSKGTVFKCSYQCCVCEKTYPDISFTVRHIKYHVHKKAAVAETALHCGQCGKGFITKQQLNKHETVHTDVRPFKCQECDKWFKTPDNVKRHMYVHNEARPFACPTCGKEFKAKHMLRKHEETHNDERMFECPECDKKYKAKNSLRDHLRVHSGQRPYKCLQCNQAFYRPSHLATHKLVHSKLKPFACKDCEKRFGRREHLKVHERIHSGEKPFKCNLCERSFNQQAGLQAHLVSHSEERPHPCLKCNKSFKYPSQVKHHACKPDGLELHAVHEGTTEDVGVPQGGYMDCLPETMPAMMDCGNDENATTANNVLNSTPCLNTANTIILIQIQNTHEVPLGTPQFMEDIRGTHHVMELGGESGTTDEVNESILHHGNTIITQEQLSGERISPRTQDMVIGIEDIVTREILETI